jgi:hypothetical protein
MVLMGATDHVRVSTEKGSGVSIDAQTTKIRASGRRAQRGTRKRHRRRGTNRPHLSTVGDGANAGPRGWQLRRYVPIAKLDRTLTAFTSSTPDTWARELPALCSRADP